MPGWWPPHYSILQNQPGPKTMATEGFYCQYLTQAIWVPGWTVQSCRRRPGRARGPLPSQAWGKGLGWQHRTGSQHCTIVPSHAPLSLRRALHNLGTHTGHRLRLADELGQARWAGLCLLVPGPSGVGVGQTRVELPGGGAPPSQDF